MFAGEVLTLTMSEHSVRDSCIAMRQKAVMEASESVPRTSPYTHRHTVVRTIININSINISLFIYCKIIVM